MDVIHHPGQTTSEVEDWYDEFFGPHSRPGDWIWSRTDGHRTMLIIFPLIGMAPALHNQLEQNGGELIHIHVNHQPNPRGWADHGPINGWDGDEDSPTLHPSIFVRGFKPRRVEPGLARLPPSGATRESGRINRGAAEVSVTATVRSRGCSGRASGCRRSPIGDCPSGRRTGASARGASAPPGAGRRTARTASCRRVRCCPPEG